jgi:hypothetical protein
LTDEQQRVRPKSAQPSGWGGAGAPNAAVPASDLMH